MIRTIVVMGMPGSGKSTVARIAAKRLDAKLIETGELFRREIDCGSEMGEQVEPYVASGKLVPAELVMEALVRELERVDAPYCVFDGFPRNLEQVRLFRSLAEDGPLETARAVLLDLPRETAGKRLAGRRHCPGCGARYNVYYDPPSKEGICDECGLRLARRGDDDPETVKKRLDRYEKLTAPAVRRFRELFPCITIPVDAELPSEENAGQILAGL